MKIFAEPFGTLPDGRQATLYTLENNQGMRADISDFGGAVMRLLVPDKGGQLADVVLAHPRLDDYLGNPGCFGVAVGRNCNRIAGGQVTIAGTSYHLAQNNGEQNLHSGPNGLSYQLFSAAETRSVGGQPSLVLRHTMPHLSDDFPGNLTVSITYTLTDDNALILRYQAVCDQETVINLTNHSYFNLAGHASGPVDGHLLWMDAPFYTPNNAHGFPTGEIASVTGTPFDFTTAKPVGQDIGSTHQQIQLSGGYDHNFVLAGVGLRRIATVTEPVSGRVMTVATDLPNVQLYTANGLPGGTPGKDGAVYGRHQALCLETQFTPNAVHMPWLRSPIFRAGESFESTTGYAFSTL